MNVFDRVSEIGTVIVKKNSLSPAIQFQAVNTPNNVYAIKQNVIQVPCRDLNYASDDNEVAYILARELSKIIVKNINPKQTDLKYIDAMSIDLMINGGYNPLAGITVTTKMNNLTRCPDEKTVSEESEYIYDYIFYNYPSKILAGYNNEYYKQVISSMDSVIKERKFNKRKLSKFKKAQAKISTARFKLISKYNDETGGLKNWGLTRDLLQSLIEPEEK